MKKRGFALLVAVIVVAVIAVLATVVTVTLSGDNDQDRIEAAADVLHRLGAAIDTTRVSSGASFAGNVTKYPSRLSQLYTAIVATDTYCSPGPPTTPKPYSGLSGNWRGPYHWAPIGPGSYRIAPGFVANNVLHIGPSTGAVDTLAIEMPGVSLPDAQKLELFIDKNGISNGLGNFVKYSPRDGTTPVTVEYVIFINPAGAFQRAGLTGGCV